MNLAVIGMDHWYTAFSAIDAAQKAESVNLIGIAETDAERRASLAERFPNVPIAETEEELLAPDNDVELVAFCGSTDRAATVAKTALQNGKHIICVKPSARTLAELDDVLEVAESSGKWFGSFEGMQRLQPRTKLLKELIQSGAIGMPLSYHQIGHGGLPSPWPGKDGMSWWRDSSKVPGGAWIDHAIYAVDLARFVFEGEITFASGIIEKRLHTGEMLEDYGVALMRLTPTGSSVSVSLLVEDTWAAESGGGYHQQLYIGTKGNIKPDGNAWVVTAGGQETRHEISSAPFFGWDALVPMLTGEAIPAFGPEDARATLAACLDVYATATNLSE